MERDSHSQLELFSQAPSGYVDTKRQGSFRVPFLGYMCGHERTILIIISFLIIGIISFSLGVERGKGIAVLKSNSRLDLAKKVEPAAPLLKVKKQTPQAQVELDSQPLLQVNSNSYTIQVASYQSQSFAQKEADTLKRQKLMPLILTKGKYTVLCVGKFPSKKMAEPLLAELKKRYGDCLIKKL